MFAVFRTLREDKSGAALVEAALLAPLLVVIGFATMDYATFVYQRHVMLTGVRDAARYLARTDCSTGAQTNAKNIAVYGIINPVIGTTKARLNGWTTATVSTGCAAAAAAYSGLRNGTPSLVSAQSNWNYTGLGFVTSLGLPIPAQISVQHTERVIGQ